MATAPDDSVDKLVHGINNMSINSEGEQLRGFSPEPNHPEGATSQDQGEHRIDIEECWSDAVIKCHHKNKLHQKSLTVHPQILQFLVRKQQTVLNKILQAKNFCFEKQNSVKCMAIVYLNEPTAEDFDVEFENICLRITTSCENYDSRVVQIQTAAWPFVYRKFCQCIKTYLEDGSIQVIQKDENKYVVGYMNVVEKTASVLKNLSGECVVEKIENMELFEILRMEMLLQSQHKLVEIQVQRELFQLMIIGEGEKVKKCIQCYHRLSDLEKLRREPRQISESLHKSLALRKMKQGIDDLLKENDFHVYWRTRRTDSSCVLECFGVGENEVIKAIEFLTMKRIQEIKSKLLQAGKLNLHEENADVFEEDDGDIAPQVLAKDSGDIQQKKIYHKNVIPLNAEILNHLKENLTDKLATVKQSCAVTISFTQGGLLLQSESAEVISNAKKQLFDIVKNIAFKKEIIKIRGDISYGTVRKQIERGEKSGQCSVSLFGSEVEPQYYKSWNNHCMNVVIAEGDIENSVSDVLVCLIDENFEPVGRSAERIFKGGWAVMNNAARLGKEENHLDVYLSSTTATLKCRRILFVSSKKLRKDVEVVWDFFCHDASKSCWRSICFPAEDSQIADGSVEKLLSTVLKGSTKKLRNRLEVVLCIPKRHLGLSELENICQKTLSTNFSPITFVTEGLDQLESSDKCLQSPIDIEIRVASILDVASEGMVDVIVNSTNYALNLKDGYVSNLILKCGGTEIQTELKKSYQHGIGYGDIAISSAGKLRCKKIIHGVLFTSWVSTGNFSLKVLESLVKKCLMAAEKNGFSTIAFPALGTGNLAYPYIHVARTMLKAVNDFGRQYPDSCINTVYIILHESEMECIKTFENVFESGYWTFPYNVKELNSNPCMQILESRLPDRGLLIQLIPEEIDELVDAVIKFSTSSSLGSGGASGSVTPSWCNSGGGYYTAEMYVSHAVRTEDFQKVVEHCFKMLEIKKVTSARIEIKDLKENHAIETIMDQFCKKLSTQSFSRSRTSFKEEGLVRYLRRLQIVVSKDNYLKIPRQIKESDSWMSKLTNFFTKKGEQGIDWKEVNKRQTLEVMCCVLGPNKEEVEKTLEIVKGKVGIDFSETGRWCVWKDYKWKLVSNVCNDELNHAVENRCIEIDVMDNDGTWYKYNFEEMLRKPSNTEGDNRPEEIRCIHDEELIPLQPDKNVWCTLHDKKWWFLPMRCSEELNNAVKHHAGQVTIFSEGIDGQDYVYDLNYLHRKAVGIQKANYEDIMMIEAKKDGGKVDTGEDALMMLQPPIELVPKENADENDLQIFEVVTGIISFQESANEETKQKILKKAQDAGCQVMKRDCSFEIKGSLSQVLEVNQQLSAVKDETSSLNFTEYIIRIPMSERDFKVFSFFGNKCKWFKKWGNSIHYEDQDLICAVSADEGTSIEKAMKKHLNEILMMNNDHIEMKDSKVISAEQVMQEVGKTYPDVCLLQKDDIIEIVCNNYPDLLQVKALLQQKVSGKVNRRAGRKFAKTESESEKKEEATASDGVVYNRRFNTDSTFKSERENQTMSLPMVKVETDEGLVIKIYTGSITRLEIDCIVNAANENLWHGGGVAAAISEAAGFKFDEESKDYIAKNGPIPVGRCGVTSAGRLPYKYVIHTVGPRWGDYRDKNRCLDDLCESVEVTFREADRLRMRSIALPAISSGIFAVPRDQCIEQYHRAVMTFSKNYSFQNLQEIHFVDRDSSMVGAIQEIFKQRRSPANQKAQLTDDDKLSSIYKKDQLNEQSSSAGSIINVSDGFLIKLHLGNIADAVTDVIVCPQDEYCSSKGQIAKAIFGATPDQFSSSHRKKKFGDILPQKVSGNSPWKMIIHAVTPRWTGESAKNPQNYEKTLNIMIQEILKTADDAKFSSIAIPLLGAGVGDYQTPMETCARNFYRAVKATQSELIKLKEIQLLLKDEAAEKAYLDIFEEGGFQIIPKTGQSMSTKDWGKTIKGSNLSKEQDNCCICMELPTTPKRLQKCGHIFCKDCIEQYFKYKPACPSCGEFYGKVMGDQPPGSISMKKDYHRLEGFYDCSSCIIVTYSFLNGSQGSEHPNPGRQYKGIVRSGYIPNNERGRLVAKLLNVAFSRRLVFTIGHSRTTGQDGVITWNDIHHKTKPTGGPERFGYPDSTYLDRVLEELAAKGVTPESADDPLEYSEYSKFIKYCG